MFKVIVSFGLWYWIRPSRGLVSKTALARSSAAWAISIVSFLTFPNITDRPADDLRWWFIWFAGSGIFGAFSYAVGHAWSFFQGKPHPPTATEVKNKPSHPRKRVRMGLFLVVIACLVVIVSALRWQTWFGARSLIETPQKGKHGNVSGQSDTGIVYAKGTGLPEDRAETVKRYRKSADQGDAVAQTNLGWIYAKGEGVPKDYTEAVKWYLKAAYQGNASAQCNLGNMYYDGDGVPKDYAEAVKWYRLAADQGLASAQYNLGIRYHKGEGVPKDSAETVKWWRKAADQGDAIAQLHLGYSYYDGDGVPMDYTEAVKWYRLAADQGNAKAQSNLGLMYVKGEGVPKDLVQAHVWWNIAGVKGEEADKKNLVMVEQLMTPDQKAEAMKLARELFEKLPKTK